MANLVRYGLNFLGHLALVLLVGALIATACIVAGTAIGTSLIAGATGGAIGTVVGAVVGFPLALYAMWGVGWNMLESRQQGEMPKPQPVEMQLPSAQKKGRQKDPSKTPPQNAPAVGQAKQKQGSLEAVPIPDPNLANKKGRAEGRGWGFSKKKKK